MPSRYDGATLGEQRDDLRVLKTAEELALLRRAVRISAQGQREVMKLLPPPDMGEMDVQDLHEYVHRRYGAECHGYTADVTRTIPSKGTFSPVQHQLYELVLASQNVGFAACRPGASFDAPNRATQEVVASGT